MRKNHFFRLQWKIRHYFFHWCRPSSTFLGSLPKVRNSLNYTEYCITVVFFILIIIIPNLHMKILWTLKILRVFQSYFLSECLEQLGKKWFLLWNIFRVLPYTLLYIKMRTTILIWGKKPLNVKKTMSITGVTLLKLLWVLHSELAKIQMSSNILSNFRTSVFEEGVFDI